MRVVKTLSTFLILATVPLYGALIFQNNAGIVTPVCNCLRSNSGGRGGIVTPICNCTTNRSPTTNPPPVITVIWTTPTPVVVTTVAPVTTTMAPVTAPPTPAPTSTMVPSLPGFPSVRPTMAPTTPMTSPTTVESTTAAGPPIAQRSIQKCEEYTQKASEFASIQTYVLGGEKTKEAEFPHMAALGFGSQGDIQWLCGGSLISEKFVITAAHCLTSQLGTVNWARLGQINLKEPLSDITQEIAITRRIAHPSYHLPSQYNDIALLELEREVQFSKYVLPICIYTMDVATPASFIATGWGTTQLGGRPNDELMKVSLEYYPNSICRNVYASIPTEALANGINEETQICAGSPNGVRDTCQGDSGGPLQLMTDKLYLVGITSFGKDCGLPESPGVYTKVLHYIPWIEENVWAN